MRVGPFLLRPFCLRSSISGSSIGYKTDGNSCGRFSGKKNTIDHDHPELSSWVGWAGFSLFVAAGRVRRLSWRAQNSLQDIKAVVNPLEAMRKNKQLYV